MNGNSAVLAMRFARITSVEWFVIAAIGVVLLLLLLPSRQTIHWVGSTDLEIEFAVLEAMTSDPIPGATIQIHSEGGFYEERNPRDFTLVAGPDGCATHLCRDCMSFGTSGPNIDTFAVHLPRWLYQVSAPGYESSKKIELGFMENARNVQRGHPTSKLVVYISLQKDGH
jgi:hypothetical protein